MKKLLLLLPLVFILSGCEDTECNGISIGYSCYTTVQSFCLDVATVRSDFAANYVKYDEFSRCIQENSGSFLSTSK